MAGASVSNAHTPPPAPPPQPHQPRPAVLADSTWAPCRQRLVFYWGFGILFAMILVPIHLRGANAFIKEHHRHHGIVQGAKFALAASDGGTVVAVCTVGRPVSRHMDDGWTLEVTRLCSIGARNACSFLYAAAWRVAKAMGYRRLITYVLASEHGASLKASGWCSVTESAGGTWSRDTRPRTDRHPVCPKIRWEVAL